MKAFIAILLFKLGIKPSASFDIADYVIYGYGKLYFDQFEYPLPEKYGTNQNNRRCV